MCGIPLTSLLCRERSNSIALAPVALSKKKYRLTIASVLANYLLLSDSIQLAPVALSVNNSIRIPTSTYCC